MTLPEYMTTAITCLNPQVVHNKYINQDIVVPCRHCSQCLNTLATIKSDACENEARNHKYSFFVTLTYSNDFVPCVRYTLTQSGVALVDACDRNSTYNSIIGLLPVRTFSVFKLLEIKQKSSNHGIFREKNQTIYNRSVEDVQRYIKRLRMQIFRKTGEYLRYYMVSEYGPKTFRPHYHILFYFDSPKTLQIFRRLSCSYWKFGNCDSQLSEGGSASYVSSYLNSFLSLPSVLQSKHFRPLCSHSRYFGLPDISSLVAAVYDNPAQLLDGYKWPFPNCVATLYPTHTLTNTLFPKVYRFNEHDEVSLFKLYVLYQKAFELSDLTNPSQMLQLINCPQFKSEYRLLNLCENWEDSPMLVSRVYNAFLVSHNFFTRICNSEYKYLRSRFHSLLEFYHSKAQNQLKRFYKAQSHYAEKYFDSIDWFELFLFYPNSQFLHSKKSFAHVGAYDPPYKNFKQYVDFLKYSRMYQHVKKLSDSICDDHIKHKSLNDANGILICELNKQF